MMLEMLLFTYTAVRLIPKYQLLCCQRLSYCYRNHNHTTTRIRIQTAGVAFGGTGLCSCRVRGVDGSCAKHLTVESYMDRTFMPLTATLIIINFSSPTLFHSRLKTFFANPSHCSLSFSSSGFPRLLRLLLA